MPKTVSKSECENKVGIKQNGWLNMVIGYCRTSKTSQELALQKDALEKYGVDMIYTEQMSGVKLRPVLEEVLKELNKGDTLVVWKLDRLGRTTKELINMIDDFDKRGINFVSITEQFDTTTPTGKFVVTMFIAMAQLERDVIVMRTKAGLEAARKRGRIGGRPKTSSSKAEYALLLHEQGNRSVKYICEKTGLSRSTYYRIIKQAKEKDIINT